MICLLGLFVLFYFIIFIHAFSIVKYLSVRERAQSNKVTITGGISNQIVLFTPP